MVVDFSTRSGWKLNADFPVSLELYDRRGNVRVKNRAGQAEPTTVRKDGCTFEFELQALTPGPGELSGTAEMAVCTEDSCVPVRVPVRVSLEISEFLATEADYP